MKRILITLFALCLLCTGFSQTSYWTVYNMKVKNGSAAELLSGIDKFMKSPTGKTMPFTTVDAKLFGSSDDDFTHQVVFNTTDKAAFAKMYDGTLQQSTDFQLFAAVLDDVSSNRGSYLGHFIFTNSTGNGNYNNVIGLTVSDPVAYLAEFKVFAAAVRAKWGDKIGLSLHRMLSGAEKNSTHVAVVDALDFETFLAFSGEIYDSTIFRDFNMKVKGIRKPVLNNSTVTLARYNIPQ